MANGKQSKGNGYDAASASDAMTGDSGDSGSVSSGGSGTGGAFVKREHKWTDAAGRLVFIHAKIGESRWAYRHPVPVAERVASATAAEGTCPEHEGSRISASGFCSKLPAAADKLMWNMPALVRVLDDPSGVVLWTAGEKDAESAQRYLSGLGKAGRRAVATTVHQGENRGGGLTAGQRALIEGARCEFRLYFDRDLTGIRNAIARVDSLREIGVRRIVIRALPGEFLQEYERDPEWMPVNDISDLFAQNGTLEMCDTVSYDDLVAVLPADERAKRDGKPAARPGSGRGGSASVPGKQGWGPRTDAFLAAVRAVRPDAVIREISGKPHISCPLSDHLDVDPSFTITEGTNGGILLTCTCAPGEKGAGRWAWLRKVFRCLDISDDWIRPVADFSRNDDMRAILFGQLFRDKLIYVRETAMWLSWNGKLWAAGDDGVLRAFRILADEFRKAAENESDEKQATELVRFAVATGNYSKMRDCLSVAAQEPHMSASVAKFDADPMILVTPECVIEFGDHGWQTREHRPTDHCRLMTRAHYRAGVKSERWQDFLDQAVPNRATLRYLQSAMGYALMGKNPERVLFFITGPTSTGKTTFTSILMNALGNGLAGPFQLSMFRTKRDDAPRPDIMKAMPRRIIVAEEGSSEWNLHADVIKSMTSGGRIEARAMRSNEFFERVPAFTPLIATNEWPEIKHADAAVKRRVVGIPFGVQIDRRADDVHFADRFEERDYSGILNWLLDGYAHYVREGILDLPRQITEITEEIHGSISPVDQFVADMCDLGPEFEIVASDLYSAYRIWWENEGKQGAPQNSNVFGREITERTGFKAGTPRRDKSTGRKATRYRQGIKLAEQP